MGSKNPEKYVLLIMAAALSAGQAQPAGDSLTLGQALERSRNHLAIAALGLEVKAREAEAGQAGQWMNPRLSLEAENFAGTGPLSGTQALETTARLEQTVELGGKRSLRRDQAEAQMRLAEGELASRRGETLHDVRMAFGNVLWLQEKSGLANNKIEILETALQLAKRRVAAGKGPPAEEMKMRVELSLARLEGEQVTVETETAKMRLSVLLGSTNPDFSAVRGEFQRLESLPAWDSINVNVQRHSSVTRWTAEQDLRRISQKLAGAENVPDLDLSAGFRQQRESGRGDYAWVGGISIPLPLWNRNRAGIAGASYRASSTEKEKQVARQDLETRARALWNGLRFRASEIGRLRTDLLPDAEKANRAAQAAYIAGRIGSLELLDGQRLLFELNDRYVEALAAYHRDASELDMLAGFANNLEAKDSL